MLSVESIACSLQRARRVHARMHACMRASASYMRVRASACRLMPACGLHLLLRVCNSRRPMVGGYNSKTQKKRGVNFLGFS